MGFLSEIWYTIFGRQILAKTDGAAGVAWIAEADMKRIFAGLIALCMLAALLVACGGKDQTPDISAGRLVSGILKTGGYASPDRLAVKGDGDWELQFDAYYDGISPDRVTDGALAYASGLSADEISLLVVKENADVETALAALKAHADREYQNYVKYDANEADKLKHAKTVTYGRYVFLVVSADADSILATIEKLVKNPDTVPVFAPETESATEAATEQETEKPGYDYSSPVPENTAMAVEDWECGTLFIGDSRLYGLQYYLGLDLYRCYAFESLSVNGVFTKEPVEENGAKLTIPDAVARNNGFTRCYLMFGINELSWANSSSFRGYYEKVIDMVRTANPDAEIYLMAIYPVEEAEVSDHEVFTNANIRAVNATLQTLAQEKQVYYLDSFAALEESGGLPAGSTNDGIHIGKGLSRQLLNYMLSHTVSK